MIGIQEILIILLIFLILFGGKNLPKLAKHLGKALRELKSTGRGFERTVKLFRK